MPILSRFALTEKGSWVCTIESSDPDYRKVHAAYKAGCCYFMRTEGPGHMYALTGRAAGFMEGVAWARSITDFGVCRREGCGCPAVSVIQLCAQHKAEHVDRMLSLGRK